MVSMRTESSLAEGTMRNTLLASFQISRHEITAALSLAEGIEPQTSGKSRARECRKSFTQERDKVTGGLKVKSFDR